ncbi:hypothetical protein WICMUC_004664 [Wickerhamomyces mucosus]|uniref:F-box domain-containing protein n=1 Tax=Wickerhamomyces mucosus TaxID=1378264 RepID=A0A9P8PHH6_9ASCO|nr:hypothetical protein WICMUC_004664 [Wickerhamomyces mucosus]
MRSKLEKRLSFLSLPVEIKIEVLSYLDVSDLFNIAETCQNLNDIINDEELWKNLFMKTFHSNRFSSVSNSYKFSVELFERNKVIHQWKRGTGIHRLIQTNIFTIQDLNFQHPKLFIFSDQGYISIVGVDKGKIETQIPVTTPTGCSSYSFTPSAALFGRFDGRIFAKLLASKTYVSSVIEFNNQHSSSVISIFNDDLYCYSGDETGYIIVWDLKTGNSIKEIKLSSSPIIKIKGLNRVIVAIDALSNFYFIDLNEISDRDNDDNKNSIRTFKIGRTFEFFEVDFAGNLLILGNAKEMVVYSFDRASFGRFSSYKVEEADEIYRLTIEDKSNTKKRDLNVAGYDGCNLVLVLKSGTVIVFNIRENKVRSKNNNLQPLCEFFPTFDNLQIPNGIPPISSVSINSTVVLLGSYNGYAAVYDALNGGLIKLVSTRIPKRYLQLNEPPYLFPVQYVKLGDKNQPYGILVVNETVQYFQFGELKTFKNNQQKKKKNLVGVSGDRKNKLLKKIKDDIDELEYEKNTNYKNEKLLDKYNGSELTDQEQIELAMVLNNSLHDHQSYINNEIESFPDDNNVDDDLARALELSILDHEDSSTFQRDETIDSNSVDDNNEIEDDYAKQIQEALKRSLYE